MGLYEDAKMVVAVSSALNHIGVSPSLGDLRSVSGDLKASGAIIPVRCKDCKHRRDDEDYVSGHYCVKRPSNGGYFCEDDDYCSYGERKEGDTDG